MDLRRIVRVEAHFEESRVKRGTGFRLGPGQVLTAQHVLERRHDDGRIEPAREIRVLLDQDGSGKVLCEPATVAWKGEAELDPDDSKALDAALLADELPPDGLEPFHRLGPRAAGHFRTLGDVGIRLGEPGNQGAGAPAREPGGEVARSARGRSIPGGKSGGSRRDLEDPLAGGRHR